MAVRLSGSFKKFTGGLKVGTPVPPWYESDALFAYDSSAGTTNNEAISTSAQLSVAGGYAQPASSGVVYSTDQTKNYTTSIKVTTQNINFSRTGYAGINTYSNLTFEGWFYFTGSFTSHGWGMFRDQTSTSNRFLLGISSDGNFSMWNNATEPRWTYTSQLLTGQWVHYAVTKTGSTWELYRNGVSQGTKTYSLAGYTNNQEHMDPPDVNYHVDRMQVVPRRIYTTNFTPA